MLKIIEKLINLGVNFEFENLEFEVKRIFSHENGIEISIDPIDIYYRVLDNAGRVKNTLNNQSIVSYIIEEELTLQKV